MKSLLRFLFVGGVLVPGVLMASFEAPEYKYEKELTLTTSLPGAMLGSVYLDEEVFAKSAPDLRDIRVVRGENDEVPFKAAEERAETILESYPVKILNNAFRPNESQTFVADFGTGFVTHNQLVLDISSRDQDFRRRVEIRGGSKIGEWNVLRTDAIIYDYSRDFKARQTTVSYPETNYRYLEVTIINSGEAALAVEGARGYRLKRTEAREVTYLPKAQLREENRENTSTDITVDLGSPNLGVKKIRIETPSENFYRSVVVYTSSDNKNFYVHGTGVIFNYKTSKFSGSSLELAIPEVRTQYVRVSVVHRDDAPIAVSNIAFSGLLRSILFKYEASARYRLFYGNEKAEYPQYDIEHVLPYLGGDAVATFVLGEGKENSRYVVPEAPKIPITERYPHLLTLALVLMVLILGGIATRVLLANKTRV